MSEREDFLVREEDLEILNYCTGFTLKEKLTLYRYRRKYKRFILSRNRYYAAKKNRNKKKILSSLKKLEHNFNILHALIQNDAFLQKEISSHRFNHGFYYRGHVSKLDPLFYIEFAAILVVVIIIACVINNLFL